MGVCVVWSSESGVCVGVWEWLWLSESVGV